MIPQLHLVTNDEVLGQSSFIDTAVELLLVLQRRAALHIRGRAISGAQLHRITSELIEKARFVGAMIVINDRVDVAFTARASGVQLGARSLPVKTVRAMAGARLAIGYSAHSAAESLEAEQAGANFILAGSIYATETHPGAAPGGLALLGSCVEACTVPVFAIGGVTAERVPEIVRTGAYGVAVIRAVWDAPSPVHAAEQLAKLLEA